MVEENPPTLQVVYATPERQQIVEVRHRIGMTAADAVSESGLLKAVPEIAARPLVLGIFGVEVGMEHAVNPGDRVEICRPLKIDPRDMRRAFAARGQVMGGGRNSAPRVKSAAGE